MTLLNVRLHRGTQSQTDKPPQFIFGRLICLKISYDKGPENDTLLRMLSDVEDTMRIWVFIPLLKRRCRVIIASDAGGARVYYV